MTERIKNAIELLKEGKPYRVGDLTLGIQEVDIIYVTGWSNYHYLENLTKKIALDELGRIKKMFEEMLDESEELKRFAEERIVEYNLAFKSGQGAFGICSAVKDKIVWEVSLKH